MIYVKVHFIYPAPLISNLRKLFFLATPLKGTTLNINNAGSYKTQKLKATK